MNSKLPTEEFHTVKPHNERLKGLISYYYFHSITKPDVNRKIIFYPNYELAITIYKNSKLRFENNKAISAPSVKNEYRQYYGGIRRELRISEMHSPFDKLGIVFSTFGLHHFINQPLSELITKNEDLSFPYFQNDMQTVLDDVFKTNSIEEKVEFLDSFFISKLTGFNHSILEQSVETILNDSTNLKAKDIAEAMDISTKTLNRAFKKHLNCTVKDFTGIVQFRKAFNHYLSQNPSDNLTKLAMDFDYYDQSEFINKFKKVTGINPKKLFSSVQNFGNEKLFWKTN